MLYPIGIQNFEDIRRGGYVYVDKTSLIYKLATTGKYYFLSRPRRFGKSLLISTMEAYFQGKKELFDGLAIASLEKDWIEYPVLHFDLSGESYNDETALNVTLSQHLANMEAKFGVPRRFDSYPARFKDIIDAAHGKTGRQVVILVDEYDKPVIDNLDNPDLQDKLRKTLRGFYGVMKSKDGFIRFGFLTGVTKIGKMSVFSDLNNLTDISIDKEYSDICGVSESDLKVYFAESVRELAEANGLTEEECPPKTGVNVRWLPFPPEGCRGLQPVQLLNTFKAKEFKEYWFETGTPSFLVKVMRKTSYDVTRLSSDLVGSSLLTDVNTAFLNPVPLLYQSGYLTIKGFDPRFNLYTLGFPNLEVKDGFLNFLLGYYAPVQSDSTNTLISLMSMDVEAGNPESLMTRLDALFSRTNRSRPTSRRTSSNTFRVTNPTGGQ